MKKLTIGIMLRILTFIALFCLISTLVFIAFYPATLPTNIAEKLLTKENSYEVLLKDNSEYLEKDLSSIDIEWLESKPGIKSLGCSSYEGKSHYLRSRIGIKLIESSFSSGNFFSDGELTCQVGVGVGYMELPVLFVVERTVIDGIEVQVTHSSVSGAVGNNGKSRWPFYKDESTWEFNCKPEPKTNEIICNIHYGDSIYIFRDKAGYSVVVGSEHYLNKKSYIFISNNETFEANYKSAFTQEQSERVIRALSSGEPVTTRHMKHTYKKNIDKKIDDKYFPIAKKMLDFLYEKYN